MSKDTVNKVRKGDGLEKIIKVVKKENIITTTTRLDRKNQLPQTNNPELLSKTIIGMMEYMAQIDDGILTTGQENYEYIRTSYVDYEDALDEMIDTIPEQSSAFNKQFITDLFEQCKKEFLTQELHFIVDQSLSLTSHQFFLHPEVEELFKEILLIIGYGEIELDKAINNSRVKWMA